MRIDSGDLPVLVTQVREQLDALGATATKITVTNDLDEFTIAALRAAPVDSYGVGTSVVTGSGPPAAGMVYKLVARRDRRGDWVSVAKKSVDKATVGGRQVPPVALLRGVAGGDDLHGSSAARDSGRDLLVPLLLQQTGRCRPRPRRHRPRPRTPRHDRAAAADACSAQPGDPAIPTSVCPPWMSGAAAWAFSVS